MEKRWGSVAASKPDKGEEDDADFVLSFGNEEDEFDDSPKSPTRASGRSTAASSPPKVKRNQKGAGNQKGAALKGAAVFRSANRVMDPWAKEEGIYDSRDSSSKDNGAADVVEKPPKQQYNRQEAMLNRVRSNQERLQPKREDKKKKVSEYSLNDKDSGRSGDRNSDVLRLKDVRLKDKDGSGRNNDYLNVPVDVSRDYYDEDDEGYERNDGRGRSSLVSPRPVGGKGSFSKSSESSSSSSSLSGGIFSDRSSANEDARGRKSIRDIAKEEEAAKKPKRKKEPRSPPLLDEDGNEMFLTLEQAEKNIKAILSSTSSGDDTTDSTDGGAEEVKNQWQDIGITHPTLLTNLQSSTMSAPTPLTVQDKACPPIVSGNDVLISTHTGSGKTLAFLAPIAQTLLVKTEAHVGALAFPQAIVVAPGRELASQIVSVAQTLFEGTGLTVALAIGGTPYGRNVEKLRKKKPDLVVGTPGRIAELIIGRPGDKGGKLKISALQTVVLDEFDALLQYDSHKGPTMAIMQALDRQHNQGSLQRVLCSATAVDMMKSEEAKGEDNGRRGRVSGPTTNIEDYLRPGYAHASVDESDLLVTSGTVQTKTKGNAIRVSRTTIHGTLHVPHKRLALEAIRKILNTDPVPQQVLIFVDSPRRVDVVIEKLAKMDIIAAPLHGGATTNKSDRAQVSKALREGYVGIVVATEMAARGIDAPYLTHVINLDLPTDASHYAHRAGRCGRGGRPGVAMSVTCDHREKGVPKRFAEELGIVMYNLEARESKLRIVEG